MHYTSDILIFHLIRCCNRYILILTVYQVIKESVNSNVVYMTIISFLTHSFNNVSEVYYNHLKYFGITFPGSSFGRGTF